MPQDTVSSRKRVPLSRHPTYAAASLARSLNKDYPLEQLQIRRKRQVGNKPEVFHLVARVSTKENI